MKGEETMTIEVLKNKAGGIVETLDKDTYPEMFDYLTDLVEGCVYEDTAYEVSAVIYNCDKKEVFPEAVANLLIEIYEDELKENNHNAICDYGSLYYTGRIGEQNYEKAVYYYDMAAKLGNRQAQENLGYCFYYGRTGVVDYEKAFHYFVKGALDNHLISLYKIGDMYKNGYYVEKDENEAYCIYRHCLECLNEVNTPILGADVHIRIADSFFSGMGVKKNAAIALEHYQIAERLYWIRLQEGDFLIKKQYERSIEMQAVAREEMKKDLPGFTWVNN